MTLPPSEMRQTTEPQVYGKLVRGYALAMAVYYFAVTPLNFSLIPSAIWPMLVCTSLSGGVSVALWWICRRRWTSTRALELAAATTNVVLLCNVVLHTVLVRDAHLLIYFAPIALVFSMIGPSGRVIYPSLIVTAVCAFLCGHFMPQDYRSEFGVAVATIMFAACGAARLLHGAIRREATARGQAEDALRALETARRRSDALAMEAQAAHAAKASFIANMTHEIRNPLSGMLGLAEALSRSDLTPQQADNVALLASSGQMLKRIVSDVLDMEKIEAGKVELEIMPMNLKDEVGGVVRLMEAQAKDKGLALTFEDLSSSPQPVAGDPTRLKQIVINLLSNAIKFTKAGVVTVRLHTGASVGEAPVQVSIDVVDTGIGFDAEKAPWLFTRFGQADVSTTRKFGGTGLGLAISRALAQQMGGDITAASVPGKGSCFTLTLALPLAQADRSDEGAAEPSPDGLDLHSGLKVLVAEDNPAVRRVLELLLEPANAEVMFVDNGQAAVEARRRSTPDAILMDMHMPDLDGLDATRAIRRWERAQGLPTAPIIILTGNAAPEDRAAARAAGADGFVTKPIAPALLFDVLATVMEPKISGAGAVGAAQRA